MSKHRVLGFKPKLRLEWRGHGGQSETEQPDHSASLGDSNAASHADEVFGIHWLRLARRAKIIDAGRYHRDADDTFQAFIESGADDDVGVLVGLFANAGSSFVDLE